MTIESTSSVLAGCSLKGMPPLIAVKNLACFRPEGDPIFVNVNFDAKEGDIIVLRARSGTG
jgi:ABC-type multidrug transport system fused ATPase/permease subunit